MTTVFTVCAVLGGALFVVRLILQFSGAGHDFDSDLAGHHDITNSDASFKILSFQGITAFLMMFGLAGRAMLLDSRANPALAVGVATVAGLFSVWVIGRLFRGATRLQSSGNTTLQEAVGAEGEVYLNIPAGGTGQVQVSYRNQQSVRDAVAADGAALKTGTRVKVTAVRGVALVVEKT